jgi:hypothetical protein
MSSQTLEDMISTLLVEEKRTIAGDIKGDTQPEMHYTQDTIVADQLKTKGRWNVIIARKWVTQP